MPGCASKPYQTVYKTITKNDIIGLEATSKMQKKHNWGHNIAKITEIDPFLVVTFFIYQNSTEKNCENEFWGTFFVRNLFTLLQLHTNYFLIFIF